MKTLIIILLMLMSGCAVALTPQGERMNLVGSDLVQALPGRPMDKCKIIKHLNVFVGNASLCPLNKDAESALKNDAGKTEANVVILTNIKYQGSANCVAGASGIAVFCDSDTLKAAGL